MTVSIKETSSTVRSIEIAIPQDALKAPFEKKVTRYRKEVQLKGFRAGAAPRHIIVSRFGKMIRQECVEELMNGTLSDELKKANIIPVSRVKVENFKDDEKADISFTAIVEVDPEIDSLVAARTEAKKAKNWAEADRIRDELKARGIEIIDTPQGAKWRRV